MLNDRIKNLVADQLSKLVNIARCAPGELDTFAGTALHRISHGIEEEYPSGIYASQCRTPHEVKLWRIAFVAGHEARNAEVAALREQHEREEHLMLLGSAKIDELIREKHSLEQQVRDLSEALTDASKS